MVNSDRIVPIEKIDYLSMIGTILKIANVSTAVVAADDVEGNFSITGSGSVGNKLANQPVVSADFKSGVTAAVLYFVADPAFTGFKVAGAAATLGGGSITYANVKKDGVTLYTATFGSGTVTIAEISPELA